MSVSLLRCAAVASVLALASACSEARQSSAGDASCINWRDDVAVALRDQCGDCHGGATPAASYDLTSYLGSLGPGSDAVENVASGDATSLLVTKLDPATSNAAHGGHADLYALLRTWVVDCDVSYFDSFAHTGGIVNPRADDFHGVLLREAGWNFAACQSCHGQYFAGGKAESSCLSCHAQGPQSCSTCHPTSELSGAHAIHVAGGPLGKALACAECHVVPATFAAPGHALLADGAVDPAPAELSFGAFANYALDATDRAGPASWSVAQASCSNVYCHGGALADASASNTTPEWSGTGSGQAACGTCHGLPPSSHAAGRCEICHSSVVDAEGNIVDTGRHLDGRVSLGSGDAVTCTSCHGQGDSPAPPRSLMGETAVSALAVGAHASHLLAPNNLRGPVACTSCHVVPSQLASPGHIDSELPAEVFPAGLDTLAAADGAAPVWDRASVSCASSYCHGGGDHLAADVTPGLVRVPGWTDTSGAAIACGTACHGAPPADGTHGASLELTQCSVCHTATMDAAGELRVIDTDGVRTSTHINGVIDVR